MGATQIKVKGIRFDKRASDKITFQAMKSMVLTELDERENIVIENPRYMVRDPVNGCIYTENRRKTYRVVFHNRVLVPDSEGRFVFSVPYGYLH